MFAPSVIMRKTILQFLTTLPGIFCDPHRKLQRLRSAPCSAKNRAASNMPSVLAQRCTRESPETGSTASGEAPLERSSAGRTKRSDSASPPEGPEEATRASQSTHSPGKEQSSWSQGTREHLSVENNKSKVYCISSNRSSDPVKYNASIL